MFGVTALHSSLDGALFRGSESVVVPPVFGQTTGLQGSAAGRVFCCCYYTSIHYSHYKYAHMMRVHALLLNSAEMNHSLQNEQGPAVLRAANFANFAVLLAAAGAAQQTVARGYPLEYLKNFS